MVAVRVDELDHHAIAELAALQHATEEHLVYPIHALTSIPVCNRAIPVIHGENEVRPRTAHPLCGKRRNVAKLVDRRLNPGPDLRADAGGVVDHAADRLDRHASIGSDMP